MGQAREIFTGGQRGAVLRETVPRDVMETGSEIAQVIGTNLLSEQIENGQFACARFVEREGNNRAGIEGIGIILLESEIQGDFSRLLGSSRGSEQELLQDTDIAGVHDSAAAGGAEIPDDRLAEVALNKS